MNGGYDVAAGNGSNRINARCDIGVGVGVQCDATHGYSVSGSKSNRMNGACDVAVGGNASCRMSKYNNSNGIKNNSGNFRKLWSY